VIDLLNKTSVNDTGMNHQTFLHHSSFSFVSSVDLFLALPHFPSTGRSLTCSPTSQAQPAASPTSSYRTTTSHRQADIDQGWRAGREAQQAQPSARASFLSHVKTWSALNTRVAFAGRGRKRAWTQVLFNCWTRTVESISSTEETAWARDEIEPGPWVATNKIPWTYEQMPRA
jgi:hypothetical protein